MSGILDLAHDHVMGLKAYEPGRPVEEVARDLGLEPSSIIKLASNENPLGPSPMAVEAMREAAASAHIYPDGGAWRLRRAIAAANGLEMEHVVMGNGSNEIIELMGHAFLKPGTSIVVAEHAFVVYRLMATLFGAETISVADPGFTHDLQAMADAVRPDTREIFIANPNNPTGTLVDREAIDRFMDKVPGSVVVVFDEAYHEFLDDPPDTLRYVREGRNVVVLRTFSKIQGLAALRVGYGLAPAPLAGVLQKCRQPFNSNALAQAAALAAMDDTEHMQRTREVNREGRAFLQASFGELGLEYVPSKANFVLVKVGDGQAVFAAMLREGVIVRSMVAYGLPEWVRISVGTMDENRRCMDVLGRVLAAVA